MSLPISICACSLINPITPGGKIPMKFIQNLVSVIFVTTLIFSSTNVSAKGRPDNGGPSRNSTSTTLDATEASHLTFMREEEKLARDVYLTFANMYPEQSVFSNIATKSEQTHTDTMRDKLEQFGLPDPNPTTNDLPSSIGLFSGDEWGWYFTQKFYELVAKGSNSELDALYVGALIEELDMHDIADCPTVMVDAGYNDPCGLGYTDESVIQTSYSSLIDGSESHLRAYVGKIEAVIGEGNYQAQYLTQEEVDAILGR